MKRKPTFSPTIGSISSLDPTEDPIDDLAHELRSLLRKCRVDRETRKAHVAVLRHVAGAFLICQSEIDYTREKLVDALSHYAPPYTTFGERENDRSETEWGFWPDTNVEITNVNLRGIERMDLIERSLDDETIMVKDRGLLRCGRFDKRGQWHEYWSCV